MTIDINLAWERLKYDINKRHFIEYDVQYILVQHDSDNYLSKLKSLFESSNYNPSSAFICEIPKGKGLVRPGTHLSIEDSLFYISLLTDCYPKIYSKIKWSQGIVDFSYVLSENPRRPDWFKNQFKSWSNFRDKSLELIKEGYSYVIFTDVTGFYENIDIPILLSDLRSAGIENDIIAQLSKCLNRWAQINNRGIPQGQSPSDLLAKLYLNPIDLALKNSGFTHLRYVDDIRIFCKTKSEAKRALIELSQLLRKRGLNLQSAKTSILTSFEANIEIESIFPIIHQVANQLREELITVVESIYGGSYEFYDPEAEISEDSEKVLEEAFRSYFIEAEESKFDKSLFHYLLNRLQEAENSFAMDYCLSILEIHPEETEYILEYSKSISKFDDLISDTKKRMIKKLMDFLKSDLAIYDYQNFKIIKWLFENITEPDEDLFSIARTRGYDSNKPYYLQRVCRKFLGKYGDDSDLDKLESQYSLASNEVEKADIICSLGRIEKSRRNSLLARLKNDGYLIGLASDYIKKSN